MDSTQMHAPTPREGSADSRPMPPEYQVRESDEEVMHALVVEDSPTMRQLIAFSLKRFRNAQVIEAVDGVDALKILAGPEKIDLILTDINMPVMDGLKLVSLVRQNSELRDIPIIIFSTKEESEIKRLAEDAGADGYIVKRMNKRDIVESVDYFFDKFCKR